MFSLIRPFKIFGDNHFSIDNKKGPQNEYLRTLFWVLNTILKTTHYESRMVWGGVGRMARELPLASLSEGQDMRTI